MILKKLSLDEWNIVGKEAHKLCFGEERPLEMNTFDFALMVVTEENFPLAYSTNILLDNRTVYMQHGGAFPFYHGNPKILRGYHMMIAFLKENYSRISTRICNKNIRMLKLAMSAGLIINGMDCIGNDIFLNLSWSKDN